jgi:hypothetical protein
MTMRRIPPLGKDLIQALDERIPERCPDPTWSEREIWMYSGKRELVNFLIKELKEQEDNLIKES